MRGWRGLLHAGILCGLALWPAMARATEPSGAGSDFLAVAERWWLEMRADSLVIAPLLWREDATDAQETYTGLISDFVDLVQRKLGVRFKALEVTSYEDLEEAIAAGAVDVLPAIFQTPQDPGTWMLTRPYIKVPMIVLMRESLQDTFSEEAMRTMRMGIGSSYGIREFVDLNLTGYQTVPVRSDRFGLIKTSIGELDLMIIDLPSASHIIETEGITNLRLAATMGTLFEFSMATRHDLAVLNRILDKAIRQISREEREQIYRKWIVFYDEPFYQNPVFRRLVLWIGGGVLALMLLALVWNRTLQHRVRITTRELQAAHDELEARVIDRTRELAETNRALQREMAERSALAEQILHISGEERARIGRDLHDSLGQKLVGVTFLTRALEGRLRDTQPEAAGQVERIANVVEDAIAQTRLIVKNLLPMAILDGGLDYALRKLTEETVEAHGVDCVFTHRDDGVITDKTMASNVFHIAQEAVNNAVKHARASRIAVTLELDGKVGRLRIEDDGCGMSVPLEHAGMGLKIMRYRTHLIDGTLEIGEGEPNGTCVDCRFPFSESAPGQGEALTA